MAELSINFIGGAGSKFKRKYLQHSLANLSAAFLTHDAAPLAQAGFEHEMNGVHAAKRFPIQPVGPIQKNFRRVQFALHRAAQSPAEQNIDSVKCRVRKAAGIGKNDAGMRSLGGKIASPNFPRRHDQSLAAPQRFSNAAQSLSS